MINSFEADVVRDVFTRYHNGEKLSEIINRLNRDGVKTKAGSTFNMNSVARIIRNEKYIGKVTVNDVVYTNVVPAIVDERLFRECNEMMDEHKHKQRECTAEKPYNLSDKWFCGYCGSMMTAETAQARRAKSITTTSVLIVSAIRLPAARRVTNKRIWKTLCSTLRWTTY